MDFYKKIVKNKDLTVVLNEKEYKCASLQAIINEAVKENNEKRLKDLVEEINSHLSDLRGVQVTHDLRNKKKCENLVKKFEECLVKIVQKKDLVTMLTKQLEELALSSTNAYHDASNESLRKIVEKIERNLEVVRQMPEVKKNKQEEYLRLVTRYEELLKRTNAYLEEVKKKRISEPVVVVVVETGQGEEGQPTKTVGLNEVEEKLKLMRQKRLNRLSTFVDQQAKLSEQRSNLQSVEEIELNKTRGEAAAGEVRRSFGKGAITRSFAERTIELAKKQASSKPPTPPRTPTNIRKFIKNINSCVLGSSDKNKSLEDLPSEFNSAFEQELKAVQLKATGFTNRLQKFKEKEEETTSSSLEEVPPPAPPLRTSSSSVGEVTACVIRVPSSCTTRPESPPARPSSLTTFRASADSTPAVSNPTYELVVEESSTKRTLKDFISNCKLLDELLQTVSRDGPRDSQNYEDALENLSLLLPEVIEKVAEVLGKSKVSKSKTSCFEKEVAAMEDAIRRFSGLKRDEEYVKMDAQLAKCYVQMSGCVGRSERLEKLERLNEMLKNKAQKNEDLLSTVLSEQADFIGRKYGLAV